MPQMAPKKWESNSTTENGTAIALVALRSTLRLEQPTLESSPLPGTTWKNAFMVGRGGDDATSAAISLDNKIFHVVEGGIFLSLVALLS